MSESKLVVIIVLLTVAALAMAFILISLLSQMKSIRSQVHFISRNDTTMTYKVTEDFMKMFGLKTLKELPELPKFKLDSNRQIVFDDLEAPSPAKGEQEDMKENEENDNEDN